MKNNLTVLLSVLMFASFAQQDPQYNLYQFNQLVINPGYAGSRDAIASVIDFRKQWVGIDGAPMTGVFSIHTPVLNNKVGIGLNAISDQIGAKSVTGIYGNVAYMLKVNNKTTLSFGARAGYSSYRFNFSKVKYYDQANETAYNELANTNKGVLDVDAGFYLKSNKFFAGFSATHLNSAVVINKKFQDGGQSNTIGDYTLSYILKPHVFLTMGRAFVVNEKFLITPSIMVKAIKEKTTFDVNVNFFVAKRLWFGVFHRNDYGFGALFQVLITDKLRFGYSVDVPMGNKRALGPSHEIMLGFDISKNKSKMVSPRFL